MGLVRLHFSGCFFNIWAPSQVVPKLLAECPGITGQAALLVPWPVNPCLPACSAPGTFCWGLCRLSPRPACSKPSVLLTVLGERASVVGPHLLRPMATGQGCTCTLAASWWLSPG